jgi:hypothetical protein
MRMRRHELDRTGQKQREAEAEGIDWTEGKIQYE